MSLQVETLFGINVSSNRQLFGMHMYKAVFENKNMLGGSLGDKVDEDL
jgi:hypothetical protein